MYLVIFRNNPEVSAENLKLLIKSRFNENFPKMTCIFPNTLSIIGQDKTDERLIRTEYYKANKGTWYHNGSASYKKVARELIVDFEETDEEKELIEYISRLEIREIKYYRWYDVNHVTTTYDLK
jgi:hypothetical protein